MAVDSIPGSPVTAARRAIPASYQGLKSNSPVERPREKRRSAAGYGLADGPRNRVEVPLQVASMGQIHRLPCNVLNVSSCQGEVSLSMAPRTSPGCLLGLSRWGIACGVRHPQPLAPGILKNRAPNSRRVELGA